LERNTHNDNILDFKDFKNLFVKEKNLKRIEFSTPKWGRQSNDEYFGFKNPQNSQLDDIVGHDFGSIFYDFNLRCGVKQHISGNLQKDRGIYI
jgi:hypothetical protein